MHFLSYPPQKFTKMFWAHFWSFHFASKKSYGRIFSIFASKIEAVCCEVQTHFGSSLPARFTEKSSGRNVTIYVSKNEGISREVQTHLGSFRLEGLHKKFWQHFFDFCVQKRSCLLWSSDPILTFSHCMIYIKCSGRIFTIYAFKNGAVCREVQTHIGSSLPASFTEKVLGAIPRFVSPKMKLFAVKFRRILEAFAFRALYKMFWAHFPRFVRPKMKLFAVEFRRILEVLWLRVLQQKFWTQFHDLCVQKRSCLPWNSDTFWKFSACEFYRKSSGRNSMICSSKNEAVCREVQTHIGSSLPASFTGKVLGAIPRFVSPKIKRFAVKFRRILEALDRKSVV